MTIETEVLWLDEHRVVSLRGAGGDFGAGEEPNCSSSCTAAQSRCARRAGAGYSFSARVVTRGAHRLPAARRARARHARGWAWRSGCSSACADLEEEIARLRALLPRELSVQARLKAVRLRGTPSGRRT